MVSLYENKNGGLGMKISPSGYGPVRIGTQTVEKESALEKQMHAAPPSVGYDSVYSTQQTCDEWQGVPPMTHKTDSTSLSQGDDFMKYVVENDTKSEDSVELPQDDPDLHKQFAYELTEGAWDYLERRKSGFHPKKGVHPHKVSRQQQRAMKAVLRRHKAELEKMYSRMSTEGSTNLFETTVGDYLTGLAADAVDITSAISICAYQLATATTRTGRVLAIMQAYHALAGESAVRRLTRFAREEMMDFLSPYLPGLLESENVLVTEGKFSDEADKARAFLNSVISGPLANSIRGIVTSLLTLRFFDKDTAFKLRKYVGVSTVKQSVLECIDSILNHVTGILRIAEAIRSGVPISEAIFTADPISTSLMMARDLMPYKDRLYDGLPVEGKLHTREFVIRGRAIRATLEAALERLSPTDSRKSTVKEMVRELGFAVADVESMSAGVTRKTPFGVILSGDPGVGKSKVLMWILKVCSKVVGREFDERHVYTKDDGEYWDYYDPTSKPFIRLPEGGRETAQVALSGAAKSVIPIMLPLVDSLPFPCNMAALEKKGTVFARPEVVITDTNNPDLHVSKFCIDPSAFYRRFLFIQISVLPEFRKEDGIGIDQAKSVAAGGNMLDRYLFRASKRVPIGNRRFKEVVLCETRSIVEFQHFAEQYYGQFLKDQTESLGIDSSPDGVLEEEKHLDDAPEIREGDEHDARSIAVSDDEKDRPWNFGFIDEKSDDEEFYNSSENDWSPAEMSPWGDLEVEARYRNTVMYWLKDIITMAFFFGVLLYDCVCEYSTNFVLYVRDLIKSCYPTVRLQIFAFILVLWYLGLIFPFALGLFIFVDWTSVVSDAVNQMRPVRDYKYVRAKIVSLYRPAINPFVASPRVKFLVGGTAIVSALVMMFRKMDSVRTEGSYFSRDSTNVYAVAELEVKIEASPDRGVLKSKTGSHWKNMRDGTRLYNIPHKASAEVLAQVCDKNIRAVRVRALGKVSEGYLLGLEANMAFMPRHLCLGATEVEVTISYSKLASGLEKGTKIVLREGDYDILPNDGMTFVVRGMNFKNIVKHLTPYDLNVKLTDGWFNGTPLGLKREEGEARPRDEYTNPKVQRPWTYDYAQHREGLCGLPVFVNVGGGSALAAVHFAGLPGALRCIASPLAREVIEQSLARLKKDAIFVPLSMCDPPAEVGEPLPKSMFHFEELPRLDYLGKTQGSVLAKSKSRLVKSRLAEDLPRFMLEHLDEEMESEYGKPLMAPRVVDGEYQNSYNIAAVKMGKPVENLDTGTLMHVKECLKSRILEGLQKAGYTGKPLTMQAAINGIEDDGVFDRINRSTSAGYGLSGKKEDHLLRAEEQVEILLAVPTEELLEIILEAVRHYHDGKLAGFIFEGSRKDEPREFQKIREGKTRIFYVSPLALLVLARMFLGPLFSAMIEHSDLFCTAVGIDMHRDADHLVRRMASFSPLIMEGDYSGFDLNMPLDIGYVASAVIFEVLEALGYNEEALCILRGLLSDGLFPHVILLKDLFVAPGLQASGKYGTAEENSLRNLIMMMYAWYSIPATMEWDFFENVLPVTYGDDVVAAVNPDLAEYYNNLTYAKFVEKHYGMKYTPASKTGELTEFVTVDTMSFLKRSFVYDEKYDRWFAPVSKSTIFKAIEWRIPSSTLSEVDQVIQTCAAMLSEVWLHVRSLEKYEKARLDMANLVATRYDVNAGDVLPLFPVFAALEERFTGAE